ncbi:MAG: vitamin K epoxide reductase family protein [Anaerolineales bacterium]
MKRCIPVLAFLILFGLFLSPAGLSTAHAQKDLPVVRAVLFFSPFCSHCHLVMTETLPPLFKKYGDQLKIVNVDITTADGQTIFEAAWKKFGLESSGVPFLVVGDDTYLVGDIDIPAKFPALIDSYLAKGGVAWPNIPGLAALLPKDDQTMVSQSATPVAVMPAANVGSNLIFAHDPAGGALAVIVLVGMLCALGWAVIPLFRRKNITIPARDKMWLVVALCVLGLGVAGYLTYVETTQTSAVCGPVGDCNAVQQSSYARLFGVLPVGLLGMVGYLFILGAYLVKNYAGEKWKEPAAGAIFGMVLFSVIFSIYLTCLEIFVIQAVCIWCLSSAVISTLLLLLGAAPSLKPEQA